MYYKKLNRRKFKIIKTVKKALWGILGLAFMGGLFFCGESKSSAEGTTNPLPTQSAEVSALIVKSGDYGYEVTNEAAKTAALRKIYSYSYEVVIPAAIDGYSIVQIGTINTPYINSDNSVRLDYDNAAVFTEKDSIVKKLVIPEGVTAVCEYAFNEMNSLAEINLPNTLKRIDGYNFMNATNLKKITMPDNVVVGDRVFDNAVFDVMTLKGSLFTGEEKYMYGTAKNVIVNSDKAYVSLGKMKAGKVTIGKKVKKIRLEHIKCDSIVLKNPDTKIEIEPDLIEAKKLTTTITKNIKCKKNSKKYTYSWNPVKIKGQKYTVQYIVSEKKDNKKIKTLKKTSIRLNKKKNIKVEVKVKFQFRIG